ncbi:hypothetical protein [Paenibacillus sp. 1P03SA]|uniref:hypothetical protein n=1 Tax=Paenibacillus sp. 1P03SA TaxID=3132294 RepID=UPI0039A23B61
MIKKYPAADLDVVARRLTNGNYVVQPGLIPDPARDKMVSDAIAKMKAERKTVEARQ